MVPTWLPYVLAVLTAVALSGFFWVGSRRSVSIVHATLTATLIAGLTFSVSATRDHTVTNALPDRTPRVTLAPDPTPTSLVTGTAVPARVQGAVETRDDSEQLAACEAALADIAAALNRAALGNTVSVTDDGTGTTARRLSNCEVRLKAIAATLPR
ncbi:MAG: hypothetical protein U0Q22_14985 [Acidimicrobiales bacterium]